MGETRRDRLRAETMREITQTARRLLVTEGRESVTLRAIAREMGMTAPALYRYYDSHQELLSHLIGGIFGELTDALKAAIAAVPPDDLSGRFLAAARTFRRWALAHEREYSLLFGTPVPGLDVDHDDYAADASSRFGWTFVSLFLDLWGSRPFAVIPDEEIDPQLRAQLKRYRKGLDVSLPLGALLTFLQCWIRLQGSVSLEVFGHLGFAFDDPDPLFEMMLEEMGPVLGLEYCPPVPA